MALKASGEIVRFSFDNDDIDTIAQALQVQADIKKVKLLIWNR